MLTPLAALIAGSLTTARPSGPGFGPGPLLLLVPLFWLAVVVVVGLLLRRGTARRSAAFGGPDAGPFRSPETTLSERFANGEIDEVEYRSRLEVLRANRPAKR